MWDGNDYGGRSADTVQPHIHNPTGVLTAGKDPADGEPPDHVPSISQRFRAPGLLCMGATGALCAFVGAFLCMAMKYVKPKYRMNQIYNVSYASGNGYWPETVSESVSDPNSAAGKIFFAFCLMAALFLILSWYPYCLRNVYTGPATLWCDCMYWSTFREYVPTTGLLMLMGVSVFPTAVAKQTNGGIICLCIHLTGAAMMFMGYMLVEFKTMEMFGMHMPVKVAKSYLDIEGPEKCLRVICAIGMAFFYCLFCLFEVLLVVQNPCCGDVWMPAGESYQTLNPDGNMVWHVLPTATVNNTASGTYFWYKVGAYTGECVAGIFLILSHYVIWFYCEERHVKFGKATLDMVYDKDYDDDGVIDTWEDDSDPDLTYGDEEYEEDEERGSMIK
jgi:hypothetical protein